LRQLWIKTRIFTGPEFMAPPIPLGSSEGEISSACQIQFPSVSSVQDMWDSLRQFALPKWAIASFA
jgi:hypothetical protein